MSYFAETFGRAELYGTHAAPLCLDFPHLLRGPVLFRRLSPAVLAAVSNIYCSRLTPVAAGQACAMSPLAGKDGGAPAPWVASRWFGVYISHGDDVAMHTPLLTWPCTPTARPPDGRNEIPRLSLSTLD